MRTPRVIAALLLSAAPAFAQATPSSVDAPLKRVSGLAAVWGLKAQLWLLRMSQTGTDLPAVDAFSEGNRVIPAGSVVSGPVGVADGSLDVFGTIQGSVLVVDGNLRIHPGAQINGDAFAVRGRLVNQGGSVTGEARSLTTVSFAGRDESAGQPHTTIWALKLAVAWFAVLVIIGIGVMIFAESNLDGVVLALERGVGRSFFVGLLGQVAAFPALLILCLALTLTIIGILLVPFAVVAYVITVAGLVTLGFLAIARLSGAPAVRASDVTPRGVNLRAMFIGLIGYFALWGAAAAFTWHPVIGGVLRAIAFIVTWVAATTGLGATLLSRGGTKRPGRGAKRGGGDDLSWQTPTPVSGVAASRRK